MGEGGEIVRAIRGDRDVMKDPQPCNPGLNNQKGKSSDAKTCDQCMNNASDVPLLHLPMCLYHMLSLLAYKCKAPASKVGRRTGTEM